MSRGNHFRAASIVTGFVTLLTMSYSSIGLANVAIKNGNFFTGYFDIVYPGGFEPKIERVYNSKSDFKGMFGPGWGNEFEVFLEVGPDGSVIVHEYGGGAENRFSAGAFNKAELDKAVNMIAEAAKKGNAFGSNSELEHYKEKLRGDVTYRNEEWTKFVNAKKVEKRQLDVGTQLQSNHFSYQYITRVKDGYVRTFDNGKTEKFSDEGKLEMVSDKNGNFIKLSYQGKHLKSLVDNFNRKMFFSFNDKGFLEKIEGENSKVAEYKYNPGGLLIYSKDTAGNVYTYKYDADWSHNLSEIGYESDHTQQTMTYYDQKHNFNIHTVKDRDGNSTEYKFDTDSRDPKHLKVSVLVKGTDGKQISSSSYEYFMRTKADGEEWQYKLVTTLDGDRTETIYNECCGLPLLIKRGKEETSFEYDAKGHVTKKITPTDITILTYEPKVGKVNKVVRTSKLNAKMSTWSQFTYDDKGNLIFAQNSEKKGVKLIYDNNGRIRTMVDQNRKMINFKYNENSKPIEISDPSLGTITVTYNNSGEIKKVDSTAGRKIALQVTSAFQNLLDIIRPAGVTLQF